VLRGRRVNAYLFNFVRPVAARVGAGQSTIARLKGPQTLPGTKTLLPSA